ncbi:MAG: GNAT family protein [Rhodothermales bacterium]
MTPAPARSLDDARITLAPLSFDNLYKHFEWNNDPELNRLDSELPYEPESLNRFKQRFEQMVYRPRSDAHDFEILAEDDTLIGVAYIGGLSLHHRHASIGVTIGDRDYWGTGHGRAALRAVMAHCFDELNLHRVAAETFEFNDAWRRLVVWAGFSKEGTARDYLFRDEQYWDKELYALLANEYYAWLDSNSNKPNIY